MQYLKVNRISLSVSSNSITLSRVVQSSTFIQEIVEISIDRKITRCKTLQCLNPFLGERDSSEWTEEYNQRHIILSKEKFIIKLIVRCERLLHTSLSCHQSISDIGHLWLGGVLHKYKQCKRTEPRDTNY